MFYRLFNILYKLTSRRGLKVFALTCVIIFIISFIIGVNQSHAYTEENLQNYGSTLTYWNDSVLGSAHNYLKVVSVSNDFGYQVQWTSSSDRTTTACIRMDEGYLYAIKNPTSSAKVAYVFFVDDITELPQKSGDTLDVPVFQYTIQANGYIYIMGSNHWLCVNMLSYNLQQQNIRQSKYPVLQTGGSSGGGGSSYDYTQMLQDTINELQDVNSTLIDIQTDTGVISGNVASILSILQNSSSGDISTAINNQTTQQQNNYNSFTNTSNYDNSVVNIDSTDYAVTDSQRC